ncbi:DUF4347 domain-containing protein [Leptolyngbya iicbica]|nr:DUF4347 domain-containing protein [Leptolyngbya sp. LK]
MFSSSSIAAINRQTGVAQGRHLVAIAAQVADHASLLSQIRADAQVVILDAEQDGIAQLTAAIQTSNTAIRSLHLISHGAPGQLSIGNTLLDRYSLTHYSQQISAWQEFFAVDIDVLIYGCEVAQGAIGQAFIQQIQQLTQANIAASKTPTGNPRQGGDPQLEYRLGTLTTALINFEYYPGILPAFGGGNSQQLWLKANAGVTQGGGAVTAWADQSGNNQNGTGTGAVTLNLNAINGNAALDFAGGYVELPAGFADFTGGLSAFVVAKPDTSSNFARFFDFSDTTDPNNVTNAVFFSRRDAGNDLAYGTVGQPNQFLVANTTTNDVINNGEFKIYGVVQQANNPVNFWANGELSGNGFIDKPTNVQRTANFIGKASNFDRNYEGQIAEILIYNDDLDAAERNKVETYLAIKYGTTLINADYTSTAGNVVFDTDGANSLYANDIFGIGQDTLSTLNQTQSRSSNDDSIVTLSNASDLDDNEFLLIGNDDGDASAAGVSNNTPAAYPERLSRLWQVAETGEVGTVEISFDLTGLGYNLTDVKDFALLVDTDTDFSNASVFTNGRKINGDVVTFSGINFAAGDLFTLATDAQTNSATDTLNRFVANSFLNFEHWVSRVAIKTGVVYQSSLVDFNIQIGGLRVAPLFDEAAYLHANPDVAVAVQQGRLRYGFEHFVLYGMDEGRGPGRWFDQDYYLEQNADVAAAVKNGTVRSAIAHFFTFGHREQRNPNAVFDAEDYLLNNPDVKGAIAAGAIDSAFEHYAEFGIEEGRQSGFLFDEAFYLEKNPDVAAAVQAGKIALGMYHFFAIGQSEGRNPSELFDQSAYLGRYGDVAAAVAAGDLVSGFEHYLMYGRAEGRVPV